VPASAGARSASPSASPSRPAHRRHSKQISELDRAAETQDSGNVAIVSPDARRAVQIARREAAIVGQHSLGTEHLLLGLLQCGDPQTVALLSRLGVSAARVRTAMESTVELPLETARQAIAARDGLQQAADEPALSPLTQSVVSRALRDTVRRGSRSLTALDLLDALLLHDHAGAAQTLVGLGVSPAQARSEIARLQQLSRQELSEPHAAAQTAAAEGSPSEAS
jgi:ATP-dependent Clp protease ATP-binding subunit ClpA